MAIDWYLLPPPLTLGEIYLQPTGKNQRSRARIRRRWLSPKQPERDWAGILPDILSLIFSKLSSFAILWPAQAVCRSWRQVSLEPHLWRRIDMRDNPEPLNYSDIKNFTWEALDRSRGRVEELYCGHLGSDQVLSYIMNQTTGLRILSLSSWRNGAITGNLMVAFLHSCPWLEELHISYSCCSTELSKCRYSPVIFRDIVQWCPKLKRIRLFCSNINTDFNPECDINTVEIINHMPQQSNPDFDYWCDLDAPNITNTMTQLRELQLINNMMTNKGLHALLDKCPHLDLLDIRLCQNIRLDAEMKARLEWIKIVRLPHDPIKKYEFYETDMGYQKYYGSNWINWDWEWDWVKYDDSDDDYMYDDYDSPYDEYGEIYDFCIS